MALMLVNLNPDILNFDQLYDVTLLPILMYHFQGFTKGNFQRFKMKEIWHILDIFGNNVLHSVLYFKYFKLETKN